MCAPIANHTCDVSLECELELPGMGSGEVWAADPDFASHHCELECVNSDLETPDNGPGLPSRVPRLPRRGGLSFYSYVMLGWMCDEVSNTHDRS